MQTQPLAYYVQQYDAYLEDFIDTFSAIDKVAYHRPIAAGKWSPGQLMEHLLKGERGTVGLLTGPAEGFTPAVRAADEKCAAIEADFRLTSDHLPAPKSLHPTSETRYSRSEQLDAFVDQRADILSAVDFADDPSLVVMGWAHPMFGHMTLVEWLYFTAIHGERHRLQVIAARR